MFDPESPPKLDVAGWLNVDDEPTLEKLKGRVAVLYVFQTHCPGSLSHALPQAQRLAEGLDPSQAVVLGLNAPFENKEGQTREKLEEFVQNQGLIFPIALDRDVPGSERTATMAAYELQGTPSILIFDRQGRLRRAYLGEATDIRIAAEVMGLAIEHPNAPRETSIAIERMLRATLVEPHQHHDHDGNCCGHDHDHHHHHDHAHHHHHDGECCNDPDCKG
ncbi:conserved protein of unknown function [Candidatus Filomicrobium marinum]|uniref:Alkyl hydroperoxide reductase subunit C/ Thiol specific antioxidant domain-containing protein n=2 Tax=Filomicrobium TaxID=119044 RepID=A0A0D6JEK8_9HYPH|nr:MULTISPECIES: TlpA disulfide reductase family protein [Filomicrobium]MCV0367845.1 TlpA family protein disulfide reductase [Filomicrobium sp.]CFX19791.1 conserved protein of unknown function [Candidatus Filomicrobium marinum]CPR18560.1 conserved protein of unknown function [Candidatus Filomicrobium marinum]SDO17195.1 Peroxiredoxin [Filomicrobium insigne]